MVYRFPGDCWIVHRFVARWRRACGAGVGVDVVRWKHASPRRIWRSKNPLNIDAVRTGVCASIHRITTEPASQEQSAPLTVVCVRIARKTGFGSAFPFRILLYTKRILPATSFMFLSSLPAYVPATNHLRENQPSIWRLPRLRPRWFPSDGGPAAVLYAHRPTTALRHEVHHGGWR